MRKAFLMVLFVACCVPAAFAQGDEYKKGEVYVGFSHNRVDTGGAFTSSSLGSDDREGFNGFNVDAKGNISRYFGVKGDFSYHQKSESITVLGTTFNLKGKLYQLMGGVQLQDNAVATKVRPFAFAVVGVGHASVDASNTGGVVASFNESESGLAAAFGGGLDVRLNDKVDLRLVKADYNPVRIEGTTSHNFRVGVGLNFRF